MELKDEAVNFLAKWILATTSGFFLIAATHNLWNNAPFGTGPLVNAFLDLLQWGSAGLIIGTFQWVIIRQKIDNSILWVVATTFGWMIAGLLAQYLLNEYARIFWGISLVAILQWLVLRNQAYKSFLIIPASIASVFLGNATQGPYNFLVLNAIGATLTGVVLIYLLRIPKIKNLLPILSFICLLVIFSSIFQSVLFSVQINSLLFAGGGNGCGSGWNEKYIPDADLRTWITSRGTDNNFSDACNAHDRCYGTLGKSKSSCDWEFEKDLISACKKSYSWFGIGWTAYLNAEFAVCVQNATAYAGFVATLPWADDAYSKAQREAMGDKRYEITEIWGESPFGENFHPFEPNCLKTNSCPRLERDEYIELYLANSCIVPIYASIHYLNLTGNWITRGWYLLNPGENAHVADTYNSIFYYYAKFKGDGDVLEGRSGPWRIDTGLGKENAELHLYVEVITNADIGDTDITYIKCP